MDEQINNTFVEVSLNDTRCEDQDTHDTTDLSSGQRSEYTQDSIGNRTNPDRLAENLDELGNETSGDAIEDGGTTTQDLAEVEWEERILQDGDSIHIESDHLDLETRADREEEAQKAFDRYVDSSDEDSDSDMDMEDVYLEDLEILERDIGDNVGELLRSSTQHYPHAESICNHGLVPEAALTDDPFDVSINSTLRQNISVGQDFSQMPNATSPSSPVCPPGLNIDVSSYYDRFNKTSTTSNSPYNDDTIRINGQIVLPVLMVERDGEAALRSHRVFRKYRVKKQSPLRIMWIPVPENFGE